MINFALLDNLKINNKLGALFAAVLSGFLALGLTYWLGVQANNQAANRSASFIEYESLSNQAQKLYLKVRKLETDFALSITIPHSRSEGGTDLCHACQTEALLDNNSV